MMYLDSYGKGTDGNGDGYGDDYGDGDGKGYGYGDGDGSGDSREQPAATRLIIPNAGVEAYMGQLQL